MPGLEPGSISLLEFQPSAPDGEWKPSEQSLNDFCRTFGASSRCVVGFLNTPKPGPDETNPAYKLLSDTFGISKTFWSQPCQKASGYFRRQDVSTGPLSSDHAVCSEIRFLSKRHVSTDSTRNTYDYTWDKLGFVTWTKRETSSAVLLCFDLSPASRLSVSAAAKSMTNTYFTTHDFAFAHVALSTVVETFDASVWAWRDTVRAFEKQRGDKISPKADYVLMHEAARHVIHSTEVLATALNVVSELMEACASTSQGQSHAITRDLAYHRSMLSCFHLRSQAIETRLTNEVQLVFHMNAQKDSLTAEQVARASQRESMTMKRIAFLGMIFLPGTLISAIFSTSFFDFSSAAAAGVWSVSDQFWIYWAVTLPITFLTLVFWYSWQWLQDTLG